MKISLKWIKDYLPLTLSADKIAERLTMAGLEVERIEAVGDDTVLELEITPNRPDCLSMLGISRELAAILEKELKRPQPGPAPRPKARCQVEIKDRPGCGRYIGTLIADVRVGPSPSWMTQRLNALGGRAVNNVVDITNFCLLESGQPLHAFDYDKLAGERIVVRRAKAGEKIVTLDGVERTLDPSVLVIADEKRPVAIAGIMGGADTEVTPATKRILLESAVFDPVLIRKASRALGLKSDSSYRFERGVDRETVSVGADRAVELILEHAGGRVTARTDQKVGPQKTARRKISVRMDAVNGLLGADLRPAQCRTVLKALGFAVEAGSKNSFKVTPPSFRSDVTEPVDVIEEVARIVGYDRLPLSLPLIQAQNVPSSKVYPFQAALRDLCAGLGFSETVTYALISRDSLQKSALDTLPVVRVQNPLSSDQEVLRPSLLPSLLSVLKGNINRGQKDLKLFEIGKIYLAAGEQDVLAMVMTGEVFRDWRVSGKQPADFFDLKGAVSRILARAGNSGGICFEPVADPVYQKGQAAEIFTGKKAAGRMGAINPQVLQRWDIKHRTVYFCQLALEAPEETPVAFLPFSEYPFITRDISLALKKDIPYQKVKEIVWENGQGILVDMIFLEEYCGEKISDDCRALVFSLIYQSAEKTLTEEDVSRVHCGIAQSLVDRLGGILR